MKDKQTKRKEALARLRNNIVIAEKHGDEIRLKLKGHQQAAKPSKPKTVLEAILLSVDVRDSLRSSLERNEHDIQRMKREEQKLANIISNESHKALF